MDTLLTAAPAAAAPPAATMPATTEPAAAPPATITDSPRWTVPEDMRTHETMRKFMDDKNTVDPGVLAKSYVTLEGQMGRDKIAIPKSDEEWGKAWDALGRPASPEAYEVKKPEMPEGMNYDEGGEKMLRTFAHQNGWNQKQFANAYETYFKTRLDEIGAYSKTLTEARSNAEGALRKEWGEAFDANAQLAKTVVNEFGDDEFKNYLNTSGLGNDPRIIKMFNNIGKAMNGDVKLKGAPNPGGAMTPAEVTAKISSFRETNHKALYDADHPDHKRLVAELQQLHAMQATGAPAR